MTTFFSFSTFKPVESAMNEFFGREPYEVSIEELNKPGKRKEVVFRVAETKEFTLVYLYNEKPEDVTKFRKLLEEHPKKYKFTEGTEYTKAKSPIRHGFYK